MAMSEAEARAICYGIGTAMLHGDKEAREMMYADLDRKELQKIIRWIMRQNLRNFAYVAVSNGLDPEEAWKMAALGEAFGSIEEEDDED
jgi:hypothetical protein